MTALLQRWVTAQAERRPDHSAIVADGRRLTYRRIEESSNRLARLLKDAGCRPGDRVCFAIPKSPDAIVAVLGILKADCIYTPLDTASPVARVARIVSACEPRCLLMTGAATRFLDELFESPGVGREMVVGSLDQAPACGNSFTSAFSARDLAAYSTTPVDYRRDPEAPAYILFTSGSTGVPKGVVISHANVWHFVTWANRYFGVGPDDRLSGYTPLYFDLSVYDVFGPLAAGAELHLVAPDVSLVPGRLAQFIRDSELTQWFSVPSLLAYMAKANVVRSDDFPSLKRLLWCGEVLPTPVLIHWMTRLPHVRFTNLYGPTEATIASSYYTVPECPPDETASVPIGVGCEGEELLVLDEQLRPVPPGTVGDLCIRGVGLSQGYWRDPEKTARAFVPNPLSGDPTDRIYKTGDLAKVGADGLVHFLGRSDSQIKSRGYRIELGEIETALNAIPALKECAVVAVQTEGFEGAAICCAYVPAAGADVTPIFLRQALSRVLPSYMLPAHWLAFDSLPRNANGKIDRPRLREHFSQRDARADRTA